MPEVPKLNLNFSSESQSGPDFKISQSSRSTHSSSTVSWGTESSDRLWTPKVSERQETKYSTNPPWATHLPLNRRKEADNFTGKQIPSFVHEENGSRIISDHNNTESDRICSALESDFRRRGTTENLTDKIQLDPTPRELSAMSLRQRPGLVRPNALETYRSTTSTWRRRPRIWFTARLNIFDPFALCTDGSHEIGRPNRIVERRNSMSSWALRAFTGLAFTEDSTFALYEDHKIGKGTKPLPFLPRRVYRCAWGERTGQPYMPEIDLFPGAVLFISYPYVECAPVPLRRLLEYTAGVVRLHVLSTDSSTCQRALEEEFERQDLPKDLWYSIMAKLHVARLPLRPAIQLQLLKLQALWRRDLRQRSRPVEAFVQLYRHCRVEMTRFLEQHNVSDESDEMRMQLCRRSLEDGLRWFRLNQVNEESIQIIWQAWDSMAGYDGPPHFMDFLRLVFGDMTTNQRAMVVKAFIKMDPAMTGHISLHELRRFYTAPSWAIKEYGSSIVPTAAEFQELVRILTGSVESPVEFSEFEALYHGLSVAIGTCPVDRVTDESQWTRLVVDWRSQQSSSHDQFERIVRDSWGI